MGYYFKTLQFDWKYAFKNRYSRVPNYSDRESIFKMCIKLCQTFVNLDKVIAW